jgi:hypothetical protein
MAKMHESSELESQRQEFTYKGEEMKNCRAHIKNNCSQNALKKESKTDRNVRIWCSRLAVIMGILGAISLLIGQSFPNGLILCVSAIALMSLALGYKQIDLICKVVRMRLSR